jgi:AraC-like DNA-binding protein
MTLVLPAVTVTAALAGFEALGHSPAELLRRAGLRREQLADPFAGVPDAAFGRLWAAAFALQPDPNLPIQAGLATPFGAFGILDHLVGSAHTVGEAMQTLALFFRLVSTTITLELRHDAGDSLWLVKTPSSLDDAISDAWTLALLVGRMRSVCASFTVEQLALTRPDDGQAGPVGMMLGTEVMLGAPRAGLRLRHGVWREQLHSADPVLYATLHTLAARTDIAAFAADPLQHALRDQLDAAIKADTLSVAQVAAQLGVSARTLQRRLAAEQISFQELLDAYRQERAMELLREGRLAIGEVAYALGYGEQSAFTRAFRRWTGLAPRAWLTGQSRRDSPARHQ